MFPNSTSRERTSVLLIIWEGKIIFDLLQKLLGKDFEPWWVVYALFPGLPAVLFCDYVLLAESHCLWSVWHFAAAF